MTVTPIVYSGIRSRVKTDGSTGNGAQIYYCNLSGSVVRWVEKRGKAGGIVITSPKSTKNMTLNGGVNCLLDDADSSVRPRASEGKI